MQEPYQQQTGNEALWHTIFAEGDPVLQKMQRFHLKLPGHPRCRLCLAPFGGVGGWFMRLRGRKPNNRNPAFCNACDKFIDSFPGGAEIDMSMLYVDIRNSTEYADSHSAASVSQRVNAFLDQASEIIIRNDGFVSEFYGDCIVATWPPGFSGQDHGKKAHQTALELVGDRNLVSNSGTPIPVGVGVHTGKIFIGTVSAFQGTLRGVSIFGRNVNLTARMAAKAKASEVLGSAANITSAGKEPSSFSSEKVELKGFSEPVDVYSLK